MSEKVTLSYFMDTVRDEGLEYAALHYHDWIEFKETFPSLYELIKNFNDAYTELHNFVGGN